MFYSVVQGAVYQRPLFSGQIFPNSTGQSWPNSAAHHSKFRNIEINFLWPPECDRICSIFCRQVTATDR